MANVQGRLKLRQNVYLESCYTGGQVKVDKQFVERLTDADIWDIQAHLDRALDTHSGSGDHWILMACLNRHGFRTHGTNEAMQLAEEIIILWYQMQK